MRKYSRVGPIIVIVLLTLLCHPVEATACPTCKGGLSDHTALGYAISIVFMMGMPFLILSFWAVTIYRLRCLASTIPTLDLADQTQFVNQRVMTSATSPNFEV